MLPEEQHKALYKVIWKEMYIYYIEDILLLKILTSP